MQVRTATRTLSPEALAAWGNTDTAYVRPVVHQGEQAYSICSADGNVLAIAATREAAFGLIRQNELEPVDAH